MSIAENRFKFLVWINIQNPRKVVGFLFDVYMTGIHRNKLKELKDRSPLGTLDDKALRHQGIKAAPLI